MKIGLVGLPLVGKTTFFNLLTHAHAEISNFASGKMASNVSIFSPSFTIPKKQPMPL